MTLLILLWLGMAIHLCIGFAFLILQLLCDVFCWVFVIHKNYYPIKYLSGKLIVTYWITYCVVVWYLISPHTALILCSIWLSLYLIRQSILYYRYK